MLISILFWPFWLSVLLAITGMIYFKLFWEAILLFLLSDLLYGINGAKNSPAIFISFFVSILILIIIEIIKKRLKFYPSQQIK
ncbi:MAG: hypothetical protein WAN61_02775 [Minisyncoccia bacterium]